MVEKEIFKTTQIKSNQNITSWWSHVKVVCVCMLVTHLCPTLCDSMDYSPPGCSVHGILQVRILEWVAIPFSEIFPTQRLNAGLLHCRWILYCLTHLGSSKSGKHILIKNTQCLHKKYCGYVISQPYTVDNSHIGGPLLHSTSFYWHWI